MAVFHYFAYGSNMYLEWLQSRCKSAKTKGVASVQDWALNFSKISKMDGSGKATISEVRGSKLFGVVFEIEESERGELDRAEGPGYKQHGDFVVQLASTGMSLSTITYIADPSHIDESLKPYDWYMDLVLAGARQQGVPVDYVRQIESFLPIIDSDLSRPNRLKALDLLNGCS